MTNIAARITGQPDLGMPDTLISSHFSFLPLPSAWELYHAFVFVFGHGHNIELMI